MIAIKTPAEIARRLGISDGWTGRHSQADKFSDPKVRAAYEAAHEKHSRLRLEEKARQPA